MNISYEEEDVEQRALCLTLAERAGNRSELLADIFEYAATPRQIQIMAELPKAPQPAITTEQLAQGLGLTAETAQEDLEDLFRKGLAYLSDLGDKREWCFAQSIDQIRDSMNCNAHQLYPDPVKLYELWLRYDKEEGYALFAKKLLQQQLVRRVIPAWRSVMNNPDLQPWEDWREILKQKSFLSVRHCPCRSEVRACDRPREVCLNFDRWTEYDIATGQGRKLSLDEAIHIMDGAASSGLVSQATNQKSLIAMCNCCSTCCLIFSSMGRHDIPSSKVFAKSRYEARIDQDLCTGCQKCIDNCNFDAIDMISVLGTKKLKARAEPEKCFGCGCCFMVCEDGAISMECVRPESHVPDTLEKRAEPVHGYDH